MFRAVNKCFYSNIRSFENLELLNSFLLTNKFPHLLVYFRAAWNPQCVESDKHIQHMAATHRFLEIVTVDSDVAPKIARHYAVKSEPEFVFCLSGDEVIRQRGLNLAGL